MTKRKQKAAAAPRKKRAAAPRKRKRAAPRKRKRAAPRKRKRAARRGGGGGFRFEVERIKLDRAGNDARGRHYGRKPGLKLYQVKVTDRASGAYQDALVYAATVAGAKADLQASMMRSLASPGGRMLTRAAAEQRRAQRVPRPMPPPMESHLLGVNPTMRKRVGKPLGPEFFTPSGVNRSAVGYRNCACRDCMETAIGQNGAMCNACQDAGCSGFGECQAEGAYGG